MRWYLLRVFGKRALFGYGVVALLSVAVLAALDLASRYGLHAYVSDQLTRIPWDISLIQRGEPHRFQELYDKYTVIPEDSTPDLQDEAYSSQFSDIEEF